MKETKRWVRLVSATTQPSKKSALVADGKATNVRTGNRGGAGGAGTEKRHGIQRRSGKTERSKREASHRTAKKRTTAVFCFFFTRGLVDSPSKKLWRQGTAVEMMNSTSSFCHRVLAGTVIQNWVVCDRHRLVAGDTKKGIVRFSGGERDEEESRRS